MTPEEKKERARIANRKFYERHKEAEKIRSKAWRLANPDKYKIWAEKNKENRRAANRKYEYGLLPEEFDARLSFQEGKCGICGIVMIRPDVDHDHSCCTGRKSCGKCIRGILCHKCNTIIGLAQDSIDLLERAIQYLKRHKESNGRHA